MSFRPAKGGPWSKCGESQEVTWARSISKAEVHVFWWLQLVKVQSHRGGIRPPARGAREQNECVDRYGCKIYFSLSYSLSLSLSLSVEGFRCQNGTKRSQKGSKATKLEPKAEPKPAKAPLKTPLRPMVEQISKMCAKRLKPGCPFLNQNR